MEIWLKQGKEKLRLPVLPSDFEITEAFKNTSVDITNYGEVNLIGKKALATTNISSFFPKQKYNFVAYKDFPTPKECVDLIKSWMDSPVRLIITGTTNMLVTIESFNYSRKDGTGDIYYSMELKQYRIPKLKTKKVSSIDKHTTQIIKPVSSRETKSVKTTTVTVKQGDTLASIAKRTTGSSSNAKAIANQNNLSYPSRLTAGQHIRVMIS
ncbi:LysM peptidoglycan-binding domain-containing protein [Anaerocolumna chitinilytica]|uniref:Phage-like element PBSX protein XkdP n=1 Tax=Anaerocolumna chitinilytica TaxID=1727145 RepID=A0A7M3S9Y9_9FIRM|nr:LysM domain-containing protein [Anaerocolumna chitinilytica]BCK01407.1 phage-like element PBSX protein XkdP [Anaerocolumna chitinilytica]